MKPLREYFHQKKLSELTDNELRNEKNAMILLALVAYGIGALVLIRETFKIQGIANAQFPANAVLIFSIMLFFITYALIHATMNIAELRLRKEIRALEERLQRIPS